jgi:DUF4097 and DUF4098 domain-containing protein YvlB
MASQVPIPPPLPPRHHRSFAGPVVLIVIGTVFLLSTMGVLHWEHLGSWFAHYWPLLLILWGVIKLVEYQQAQRAGLRPSGIGAGGIFLLIVLICFGLVATQAARLNWDEFRDHINIDDNDFEFFGHNYSFDAQLEQAFPPSASLHVIDDRGAVNITTSEDNQIHVVVRKRINAESQGDADKWNGGTNPQITVSGNILTLNANTQGAGDHRVTTDMDVAIPRKASVVLTSRRGDINIMGREGDADISSQKGDVSVTDVTGKVSLSLEGSSARVSQISSDVSVEGRPSDVSLDEVKGAVRLTGEFDSLKLSKIAGPVNFKSARTDLEFSKIEGDLDMDSDDLRASDLSGPLHLSTRDKDIRLSGISGDVRLSNENGAVEIRMNKLGSVQVENRSADIQIYLPDKAGFQVDARTREGEIQSDFGDLKISNADDRGTATGTIGGGGPKLVINNEHGGIEIRKGSGAPPPPPPAAPSPQHGGKQAKPPAPAVPEATEN